MVKFSQEKEGDREVKSFGKFFHEKSTNLFGKYLKIWKFLHKNEQNIINLHRIENLLKMLTRETFI